MSLTAADSGIPSGEAGSSRISKRQLYVLLAVLAVQLILVSPSLMPGFPQINAFDEARYIVSGRQLLQFEVRDLAWGPLVAVVYAPLHLVLGQSPDWFMLEAWVGRFLLFIFLWVTTIAFGLELRPRLNPYVLAGVLFVSVPFFEVVSNQSDALFAGLAALAVSRLLAFRRTHQLSSLIWGSLLVGLAVLSRAEAVLLLGLYPILAFAMGFRRLPLARLAASVFAPALALLCLYLAAFWWSTGSTDLGFQGKAYDSFEVNQPVTAGGDVAAGRDEVRRLFGTAQDNHNSVFRAVLRNPKAFALRLWASAKTLPDFYLSFFQKKLGPALMLLALWGIVRLLSEGRLDILVVLAIWAIEPLTSIAFLPRHLVPQLTYMILGLSAVGTSTMLQPRSASMHWMHLGSWAALALFGWVDGKAAFLVTGVIVLMAMALIDLHEATFSPRYARPMYSLLLLLVVGVILRTPFPFPNYTSLGTTSEEQAINYLESHVPSDSLVMAPYPGPALAARMTDVSPTDLPANARTSDGLLAWLRAKGVAAIYLDQRFRRSEDVYDLVDSLAGDGLRIAYQTPDGRIRILLPPP